MVKDKKEIEKSVAQSLLRIKAVFLSLKNPLHGRVG